MFSHLKCEIYHSEDRLDFLFALSFRRHKMTSRVLDSELICDSKIDKTIAVQTTVRVYITIRNMLNKAP